MGSEIVEARSESTGWLAPRAMSTIASSPPTRWRSIALALGREICEGDLPCGQRLDSESRLAARFEVNRHTVRQALQRLAEIGFIEIRQGSGSFVRPRVLEYPITLRTQAVGKTGAPGTDEARDLVDVQFVDEPAWLNRLGMARPARLRMLQIRASRFGHPISLHTAVFPSPRFDDIHTVFARTRSIDAALEAYGVDDCRHRRSAIVSRLPTPFEAAWLQRPSDAPVLVVDYVNVEAGGKPVEAGQTVFAGDAIRLIVESA